MEKLRLQEAIILKKIENFNNDLHVIRAEMEFLSMYPENQQKDISSPSSSQSKDEAIPEQTASGKETTNPLKAVALPKSKTEVQTSTTLVKSLDLNLRPNGGIQIPYKSEGLTSAVPIGYETVKNYYVVFNGPNAGIYPSWDIAEKAVKGFSSIKHRKYKSFAEARVAANIYTTEEFKTPLQLICSAEALQPTYAGATTKLRKTSNKTILGKIPTSQQPVLIQSDEDTIETHYSGFRDLYHYGRVATEKEFVEEHFFTTDKKNVSYFNFYPNSNPEMVYEAFQYGLLAQIYPANNLLEISKFPKEFKEAVKTYKKKCLKGQDTEIFIKTTSTIICWENEEDYDCPANQPFHYVQIGTAKEKIYSPSQAMQATLEKKDLREFAEQKLLILISKIFNIQREDKLKVNLATTHNLMTSYSHNGMSEEDYNKVVAFRKQLLHQDAVGVHQENFCRQKQKETNKFGFQLDCQKCGIIAPDKTSGKKIMEDPTSSAEDKELLPETGILLRAKPGNRF